MFAYRIWLVAGALILAGCSGDSSESSPAHDGHEESNEVAPQQGSHGGRLLVDGEFVAELAIFEAGTAPEFRVWITDAGEPIASSEVDLRVTLARLGNVKDEIVFSGEGEFLRSTTTVVEPHSFVVNVEARHANVTHRWVYDNFEGRTRIGPEIAEASGLKTEVAGPVTIRETVHVYGRVMAMPEKVSVVSARFEGVVQSVYASIGSVVERGQVLAEIESNESLLPYSVTAPIRGVITNRVANAGEQTAGRPLFTITDTSALWAELAVFPSDRRRVQVGAMVVVSAADGAGTNREGKVAWLNPNAESNQSVLARVVLDNSDGAFLPGSYVTGEIQVAEHAVPLAVRRSGVQAFRQFDVVFEKIGDTYEVRMLDLGRKDVQWVEVLGGLEAGARYVSANSYLVKADIEKTGASHDH